MGSFDDAFWNLFIIVCTLGGIAWLYLLTVQGSRGAADRPRRRAARHRRGGTSGTRI